LWAGAAVGAVPDGVGWAAAAVGEFGTAWFCGGHLLGRPAEPVLWSTARLSGARNDGVAKHAKEAPALRKNHAAGGAWIYIVEYGNLRV